MNKCCRLRKSRNNWKSKAVVRAETIREMNKKIKILQIKYLQSETVLRDLRTRRDDEKGYLQLTCKTMEAGNFENLQAAYFIRIVCVFLVISAVLPFRAVPRVLSLLNQLGIIPNIWIPHFTSVINWTLRVGIATLQNIVHLLEPWIAIIDTSIDIGTRKALVVLRVPLLALQAKGGAIGLEDCECIGIKIEHSWTGISVEAALEEIFEKAGKPQVILKDNGADIKKGVVLWNQNQETSEVLTIDDIGHETANALKAEYAKTEYFQKFIKIINKGAARIRQTALACVLPPKIRTKGRFQGITKVAKWAEEIMDIIGGQGRSKADSTRGKLRRAFSGLSILTPFLKKFIATGKVVSEFLKLFKNKGFTQATYHEGMEMIEALPKKSKVRMRLENWLDRVLQIQLRLDIGLTPLIVSSDVIESLFGKFKVMIQRNPMAELNRLVYTIPLLCGKTTIAGLDSALKQVRHTELQKTLKEKIPETLRSTRQKFFTEHREGVPKTGKAESLNTS